MKHTIDAIGKQCPVPVVMTKKVLDQAEQGDEIQILVDNETAVNNLSRLAGSTGCSFVSKKTADGYEIRRETIQYVLLLIKWVMVIRNLARS